MADQLWRKICFFDGLRVFEKVGVLVHNDRRNRAKGIFDPLGMCDSSYVLPTEMCARRVYRAAGFPGTQYGSPWFPGIDSPQIDAMDWAGSGATSTAADLAAFFQMLMNGGRYGERRILSRASVATMTRAQTSSGIELIAPGINSFLVSGYGFGLFKFGDGDRFRINGSLTSQSAIGHGGAGGACVWADPAQELVGVYLCVSPRNMRDQLYDTNSDLFQNAVHAAVVD